MTTMAAGARRVLPSRLRFTDVNPLTGGVYGRSRYADLPGHAEYVVSEVLRLSPMAWDDLVRQGRALAEVGYWRSFDVSGWFTRLASMLRRAASTDACADCWGTGVEFDVDGSLTGTVGAPVVCWCSLPRAARLAVSG
ncbi:hypothetical protein ACQPW3_06685 [Actinosynnema sp. CA-248983]